MSIDSKTAELLGRVIARANEHYDGHVTICKYTTNWKACFYTQMPGRRPGHATLEGCLRELLSRPLPEPGSYE